MATQDYLNKCWEGRSKDNPGQVPGDGIFVAVFELENSERNHIMQGFPYAQVKTYTDVDDTDEDTPRVASYTYAREKSDAGIWGNWVLIDSN